MVQEDGRTKYPDVDALRSAFPVTNHCTYLNHAAVAPLPNPVRAAMSKYVADRGVIYNRKRRYEHLSDDLRAVLAWLINAAPEEIAFVQNTSEGLNILPPEHPGTSRAKPISLQLPTLSHAINHPRTDTQPLGSLTRTKIVS